jgi:group I intron endonuclease
MFYIGKTKTQDLQRYWSRQRWLIKHPDKTGTSKPHLYNAVRKYGWENFSIHPLIVGIETEEELLLREQEAIEKTGAQVVGYNICAGGRGAIGWKPSEETKQKISSSNRGKHRDRLLSPGNQKVRIAAWQASLEAHGGSFQSPESQVKIKAARTAQDEEARLLAWQEWYRDGDAERRQRAANTHRGTKHNMSKAGSAAISKAFSEGNKRRWSTHSLIGQVFERLTVESEAGRDKRGLIQWNCRCECGRTTIATTTLLRTGHKKSCGCLARDNAVANLKAINGK